MEKGTKIKFLVDIVDPATGDHPAFQLAITGQLGTINEKRTDTVYSVYWDGWSHAPFLADINEFEIYNENN